MTDDSALSSHTPWPTRPVLLLVLARAVNQAGAFTLPFLAVLLVTDRGATVGTAGLVVGLFGVATIPSRLLGGHLCARIGPRATLVLGLVLCAVAQLGLAIAPDLRTTLVAVVALGLAFEVYEPASQSLLADLGPAEHLPRTFALFGAALALGGLLGGLLGSVLAGIDLRLLFVVDAATCLTCAVVVRAGLPVVRRAEGVGSPVTTPWRDRRLLAMLGTGTAFATLYLQLRIALPLTLLARHLPVGGFGLVTAVAALTVLAGQPVLAWSRVPREPFAAMTLGYLLLAAGLAATGLVTSTPGFLLAAVVWAAGDVLLLGHPFAVVAGLVPEGDRAPYLAAYGVSWGFAAVLAPVFGTTVLAHAGPTALWTGCAVLALGLAALQPALRRVVRSAPSPADRCTPARPR